MTPNYETFECQFAFGHTPKLPARDEAFATACFKQCPTAQKAAEGADGRCHRIAVDFEK